MLQFHSVEFEFKKIWVFFGVISSTMWSWSQCSLVSMSWSQLVPSRPPPQPPTCWHSPLSGHVTPPVLCFFHLPCVLLPPPRASSLLSKCFQQKLAAPFSSFLSPLPILKKMLFFLPPHRQNNNNNKNKSNNPSPSCNRRIPVNTVSLLCLSCGKKKRCSATREQRKYLTDPVLLSLHAFLLSPAFMYQLLVFITTSALDSLSLLTSSGFSNYISFCCASK